MGRQWTCCLGTVLVIIPKQGLPVSLLARRAASLTLHLDHQVSEALFCDERWTDSRRFLFLAKYVRIYCMDVDEVLSALWRLFGFVASSSAIHLRVSQAVHMFMKHVFRRPFLVIFTYSPGE